MKHKRTEYASAVETVFKTSDLVDEDAVDVEIAIEGSAACLSQFWPATISSQAAARLDALIEARKRYFIDVEDAEEVPCRVRRPR
mgnify:CR=1 FL=1